jgi:Flp pilus assembly protein TadD
VDESQNTLRKTVQLAPNWYKPHWLLAHVLKDSGRANQARLEADQALALAGSRRLEIHNALDGIAP